MPTLFQKTLPALALSTSLILSGCAASSPDPSVPTLPAAPAEFGQPVTIPAPKKGENAKIYAGRLAASHRIANGRLENDGAFYADVLQKFGRQ